MADSTQYIVDIVAKLQGGDSASATLATLGDRMVSAGSSAEALQTAVTNAKSALESAASASTAAASAVTAGEAAYKASETSADNAAKAVERIGLAAQKQQALVDAANQALQSTYSPALAANAERLEAKLAAINARQAEAQGKASAAASALQAEGAALDALRAAASSAADEHKALAGGLGNLEDAASKAAKAESDAAKAATGSGNINEMSEALGKLGGPLGRLGQQATGAAGALKKIMGAAGEGAGAIIGLSVIVVALAAAFAYATFRALVWSVGLADANRTAALTVEAVSATSESLAGLAGILPEVQRASGLAASDLTSLAQQLAAAKVSAADMPAALRAVALQEAALGKGGAASLVESLKAGKKSAAALAAEVESKFGGIVARKLLSLEAQSTRLKANLAATFGGLEIEPALKGLDTLGGLLDSSTASGRALKFLFEKTFQPLLGSAVANVPSVEALVLGLEIGVLRAYVAMKPLLRAFDALGGSASTAESTRASMAQLGETVGIVAAVGGAVLYALAYPFIKIGAGISAAIQLSQMLAGVFRSGIGAAVERLSSFSLVSIGSDLIAGLAEGITGSAGKVISAITGTVGDAVSAAKSLLGIASPSKVFAEIGGYTAEGFAGGVEDGAGNARSALEAMVEPPAARASGGAPPAHAPVTITGPFHFYGVKDAEDAVAMFEAMLTRTLEGDVLALGGAST